MKRTRLTPLIYLSISGVIAVLTGWYYVISYTQPKDRSHSSSIVATPKEPSLAVIGSPSPSLSITPSLLSPLPSPSALQLKKQISLAVPFTIQAPDSDWSEPWKEGCEEAALLMVSAYRKGDHQSLLPPAKTKGDIAAMVAWETERFGSHKNLGVEEMAVIAREYLNDKNVRVEHQISMNDIKEELRQGNPVIVPAAGQLLGNPYFKTPGPLYHVFVLTGFDGNTFIANENGTKRGYHYHYASTVLEYALHNWQEDQTITTTPNAYLIIEKE